jgi:hypothetical protein
MIKRTLHFLVLTAAFVAVLPLPACHRGPERHDMAAYHQTVVPGQVESRVPSFSGNTQTSGDVAGAYNAHGRLWDSHKLARYDGLLAAYGDKIAGGIKPGDRIGITKEGDYWRVTYEVAVRFTIMNQMRLDHLKL